MSLNNQHIIYTAEDIQKYFSGKLSPAEMHAMEKAALEDIFLAEAMEGYGEMKETDWKPQLQLLKNKFEESQTAKIIAIKAPRSYVLWKVAAAVIVFCSGIAITYILTTRKPVSQNSIAAVKTKQDSINSTDTALINSDSIAKKTAPLVEKDKNAEQILDPEVHQNDITDSPHLQQPNIVNHKKGKTSTVGKFEENQQNERTDLAFNKVVASAQQSKPEQYEPKNNKASNKLSNDVDNYKLEETANIKTFKAKVVAPDGSPIAFANIRPANNQSGTYADTGGNFTLKSADSILHIDIKSVGYIPDNFTLGRDLPLTKFVLKPDAQKEMSMNEVVVRGYGAMRKSPLIPDSTINVAPLDGWDNYEIYIANNLILPANILQKKMHGEVVISFVVKTDGTLKNLKIEKSLCEECDKAAMRVIRQGPRWRIIKTNKPTGKVVVKF